MPLIIFGIGSNLGNKIENISKAYSLLKLAFGEKNFLCTASIYKSEPLVQKDSPEYFKTLEYYNSAIAFNLFENPAKIFKEIKEIEVEIGRKENRKWAPREIDIDILIYEQNEVNSIELTIPHKELKNRDFALLPLIEILNQLNQDITDYQNAFYALEFKTCHKIC